MTKAKVKRLVFLGKLVLIVSAYFIAAKVGLLFAFVQPNTTAIWAPTGIAIGALLIFGTSLWPAVLIGAFLSNITTGSTAFAAAIGIAIGNTLEAFAAAWLVNRFAKGVRAPDTVESVFEFSFWAGVVAPVISATIGTLSLALAHQLAWSSYISTWTTWWLGDLGGALIITPVIILWYTHPRIEWEKQKIVNAVALVALFVVFSYFILHDKAIFIYLMFPILVWVAFTFGNRVIATGVFVVAEVSLWGTLHGLGPFLSQSGGRLNDALLLVDGSMAAVMVTMLAFAATVREHNKSHTALEEQYIAGEEALSNVNDSIIVVDRNGKILFLNPHAETLLGISHEAAVGHDFFEYVAMQDEEGTPIDREDRPLARALESGDRITNNPAISREYYIRSNGERMLVSYMASPVIRDGAVIGAVEFFRDVTEEQKSEKERTDLLALASHQLRTPLSVIGLSSELLQGQGKLFGVAEKYEIDSYAKDIQTATKQMMNIVNDLLSVSRIESQTLVITPVTVDMEQLTKDVLDAISPEIKVKRLKVNLRIARSAEEFLTDRSMITIIIQNLISNAVKYAAEGTQVGISISREKDHEVIMVTDAGRGIPERDHPKIFTKFFRASNVARGESEGTGLGLYITKGLVEQLGGIISFVSAEGQGTTFVARIPSGDNKPAA